MTKPVDTDQDIASFPEEIQTILQELRATIKVTAQDAIEVISYSMPAFKLNGMLVWFAAHNNHTGFYPGASTIAAFKDQLAGYKWAKGSVQFPFNKPLPLGLIIDMLKFKMAENRQKLKIRKKPA